MRSLLFVVLLFIFTISFGEEFKLDHYTIEREWIYIKEQTNAPPDLPMPPIIVDSTLPQAARMMFQFPTQNDSNVVMQIMINPNTTKDYNIEMIDWGIGHELTHYAFILKENNWELNKPSYVYTQKHHCNKEFMRITRNLADVIYNIYHGERERYRMWDEVQRSCVTHPNQ